MGPSTLILEPSLLNSQGGLRFEIPTTRGNIEDIVPFFNHPALRARIPNTQFLPFQLEADGLNRTRQK
jgi:hypothetical protein